MSHLALENTMCKKKERSEVLKIKVEKSEKMEVGLALNTLTRPFPTFLASHTRCVKFFLQQKKKREDVIEKKGEKSSCLESSQDFH